MKNSLTIGFDLGSIDAAVNAMQADVQAAVRPAAQAGAQVLYDEVQRNVAAIRRRSGNLARSIYQAHNKDGSGRGREVYHVSWNARKAPHGHLVEFGHLQRFEVSFDKRTGRFITHKDRPLAGGPRQVAARPFIRPAIAAKRAAIVQAMEAEFWRRVNGKGGKASARAANRAG